MFGIASGYVEAKRKSPSLHINMEAGDFLRDKRIQMFHTETALLINLVFRFIECSVSYIVYYSQIGSFY